MVEHCTRKGSSWKQFWWWSSAKRTWWGTFSGIKAIYLESHQLLQLGKMWSDGQETSPMLWNTFTGKVSFTEISSWKIYWWVKNWDRWLSWLFIIKIIFVLRDSSRTSSKSNSLAFTQFSSFLRGIPVADHAIISLECRCSQIWKLAACLCLWNWLGSLPGWANAHNILCCP